DNYFRGFPALWNCVAFYLLLLRPSSAITAAVIVALAVLTFVPFTFVHPLRVERWRGLTLVLLALGAVLAAFTLVRDMAPGPWVTGALCAIGLYVVAVGILRGSEPAPPE